MDLKFEFYCLHRDLNASVCNLPFSPIFCTLIPGMRSRADYEVNKVVNAQGRESKL